MMVNKWCNWSRQLGRVEAVSVAHVGCIKHFQNLWMISSFVVCVTHDRTLQLPIQQYATDTSNTVWIQYLPHRAQQ